MVKLLYKLFLNAEIANATTITRITRSLNLNNMNMNMNNKYRSYSTSDTGIKSQILVNKGKGFLGYNLLSEICSLVDINISKNLLISRLTLFLNSLEEGKLYQALPIITYLDDNGYPEEKYTLTQGLKISKYSEGELLGERLLSRVQQLK